MKKKLIASIICISLLAQLSPVFAADSTTPEPYEKDEFPSWLSDLRRAEIITLGAMPFITLNASLCYSFGNYALHDFDSAYFVNPFAQTSDANSFSTDEQIGILLTSFGICLGIGITDFIVHSVKRSKRKKQLRTQKRGNINIESIADSPDATHIPPPPFDEKAIDSTFSTSRELSVEAVSEDFVSGSQPSVFDEPHDTENSAPEIKSSFSEVENSSESETVSEKNNSRTKKARKPRKLKAAEE